MPSNPRRDHRLTVEPLDDVDQLLLVELQHDARVSVAELGRRVGLSPPAVAERLRRLEDDRVILGYHAEVDPRQLGYALRVSLRVRPHPRRLTAVASRAHETPEVVECHRLTGEDCLAMTAHVRDLLHLEELVDSFAELGHTTTEIVQSSPVPRRPAALLEPT